LSLRQALRGQYFFVAGSPEKRLTSWQDAPYGTKEKPGYPGFPVLSKELTDKVNAAAREDGRNRHSRRTGILEPPQLVVQTLVVFT